MFSLFHRPFKKFPVKTSSTSQSFWSQVCIYSECNSTRRLASQPFRFIQVTQSFKGESRLVQCKETLHVLFLVCEVLALRMFSTIDGCMVLLKDCSYVLCIDCGISVGEPTTSTEGIKQLVSRLDTCFSSSFFLLCVTNTLFYVDKCSFSCSTGLRRHS